MDCKVAALPAMTGKRESVIARKARKGRRGDPVGIVVRDAKVSAGLPRHFVARNDRCCGVVWGRFVLLELLGEFG